MCRGRHPCLSHHHRIDDRRFQRQRQQRERLRPSRIQARPGRRGADHLAGDKPEILRADSAVRPRRSAAVARPSGLVGRVPGHIFLRDSRMAATDLYKQLYQGQLPSSVGTIATVSGSAGVKGWIIKNIKVVNNDSAARTFALYRGGTAASNIISPPNASIPAGGMAEWDGTDSFDGGTTIAGVASAASQLTITISGDEVTY